MHPSMTPETNDPVVVDDDRRRLAGESEAVESGAGESTGAAERLAEKLAELYELGDIAEDDREGAEGEGVEGDGECDGEGEGEGECEGGAEGCSKGGGGGSCGSTIPATEEEALDEASDEEDGGAERCGGGGGAAAAARGEEDERDDADADDAEDDTNGVNDYGYGYPPPPVDTDDELGGELHDTYESGEALESAAELLAAHGSSSFLAPLPIQIADDGADYGESIDASLDLESQLIELKLALANARTKLDERGLLLRQSRADGERTADRLAAEAERLRELNASLEAECAALRRREKYGGGPEQLAALRADGEALAEEKASLSRKVREMELSGARQQTVIRHCMEEAAEAASKRTDLMEKLAGRVVEAETYRSRLAAAERDLEESRARAKEMSADGARLEASLRQVTSVKDQLQASLQQAMDENEELTREVRALNRSNIDLSRRLDMATYEAGSAAAGGGGGLGMWVQNSLWCLANSAGMGGGGGGSKHGRVNRKGGADDADAGAGADDRRKGSMTMREPTERTVVSRQGSNCSRLGSGGEGPCDGGTMPTKSGR